jgi:hypothetical protein
LSAIRRPVESGLDSTSGDPIDLNNGGGSCPPYGATKQSLQLRNTAGSVFAIALGVGRHVDAPGNGQQRSPDGGAGGERFHRFQPDSSAVGRDPRLQHRAKFVVFYVSGVAEPNTAAVPGVGLLGSGLLRHRRRSTTSV